MLNIKLLLSRFSECKIQVCELKVKFPSFFFFLNFLFSFPVLVLDWYPQTIADRVRWEM